MKKIISAILVLTILTIGLSACGGKNTGTLNNGNKGNSNKTVTLKVWGSQDDQPMLKELIEKFKSDHKDKKWDITLSVVGEDNASKEILKDVSEAADVFSFASDQIATLKNAGALYRITSNIDKIKLRNIETSVDAATIGNDLYAYPVTSDTFFLYYDKAIFNEDEVKSLEKIMEKQTASDITNFAMKMNDGWYNSSFFFTAGCKLFGDDGTDPKKCDFNNEMGVAAGNYMIDLASNKKFANYDDAKIKAGFKSRKLGSAVSGTWNADDIKESLGDDFGVTKLPTVKILGSDRDLISMANFKLIGVNAQTKFPEEAHLLADYLTDKEAQTARFEKRSYAPTHKELSGDDKTLSKNPVVAALSLQSQNSVLQTSIDQVQNFWTPAEAFGTGIVDGSITKSNLKEKLNSFVESVLSNIKKDNKD